MLRPFDKSSVSRPRQQQLVPYITKKIDLTYLNSSVTNVIYDIFKVLNRRFNDDKRIDLT
jgi:hypothetical protein